MLLAPGQHEIYALKDDEDLSWLDAMQHGLRGWLCNNLQGHSGKTRLQAFISEVRTAEARLSTLSDSELQNLARQHARNLRGNVLRNHEWNCVFSSLAATFACITEASQRVLGMRHFDCQIQAGLALFQGKVAEMATGEGKTLTATLAAASAGLMNIPVHVISVNDYLTARDAEEMRPLYEFLGLEVGCVNSEVPHPQRRNEYAKEICYCTSKDVTFDYLRDRLQLGDYNTNTWLQTEYLFNREISSQKLTLRGLHYAIVDEADSVLIDEAKTPLIISANKGGEQEEIFLREASELANKLEEVRHFSLNYAASLVQLNAQAKDLLEAQAKSLGAAWQSRYQREAIISQALAAKYFFQRDKHYIVRDGKVEIVDENTGRVLPDRAWERGLHQLIEIKEACKPSQQRETLNKISYQRFFRRYLHLAGMTGTGKEIQQELWQVYNLATEVIPRNKPCQRRYYPTRIFENEAAHITAIVESTRREFASGRPVLIGTASVAESEFLSQKLREASLPHTLLNAKQNQREADIIAMAGQNGAITIATQMAGRGTDIKLSKEAHKAGGLHVIISQLFEANRIDRQLAGRSARQGDPGSCEALLCSAHIDLRNRHLGFLADCIKTSRFLPKNLLYKLLLRWNQKRIEKYHRWMRQWVFSQDEKNRELLAFSGKAE